MFSAECTEEMQNIAKFHIVNILHFLFMLSKASEPSVKYRCPVNLLMVDNVPFVLELITDILEPITAKLLLENGFNILQDHCIIDQFSILGNGHLTGLRPRIPSPRL